MDKKIYVYSIVPDKFFMDKEDEIYVNKELENLKNAKWEILHRAGANKGDYLIIKSGIDKRECVKTGRCQELKRGIYALAEIIDINDHEVAFKIIKNYYENPITDKNILNLKGFKSQNRGLSKVEEKDVLYSLLEIDETIDKNNTKIGDLQMMHSLSQILYGPPGTGKTYETIALALEIINEKEQLDKEILEILQKLQKSIISKEERKKLLHIFEHYKEKGQIEFVTFHQSYSYEEFVEGIKPDLENEQISYKVEDGIFKRLCTHANNKILFYEGQKLGNYYIIKITNECIHLKKPNNNIVILPLKYILELVKLYRQNKITLVNCPHLSRQHF